MVHTHTGILLSHKKTNETNSLAETQMNLESVIQREVKSERRKPVLLIFAYIWNLENCCQ